MAVPKEKLYTAEEFFEMEDLPIMTQLINGVIVDMSPLPARRHQKILSKLNAAIYIYIESNKGKCEVYPAPFDVKIDDRNVAEPDIFVSCDPGKLDDKRHYGAPDWVIEIVSPSSVSMDYHTKLALYRSAGVREYWIIDPLKDKVTVHIWEGTEEEKAYSFDEDIPVYIYRDAEEKLFINLSDI